MRKQIRRFARTKNGITEPLLRSVKADLVPLFGGITVLRKQIRRFARTKNGITEPLLRSVKADSVPLFGGITVLC